MRIKIYLMNVLMVLVGSACSIKQDNVKVIAYGTHAFTEYVKNAPVSLDAAWKLQAQYDSDKEMKKIAAPLFFIINDKYLFTPYFNNKIPEVHLQGISVDCKSGKVAYINLERTMKPKSQFGWRHETERLGSILGEGGLRLLWVLYKEGDEGEVLIVSNFYRC